jgi:hypothetical protein
MTARQVVIVVTCIVVAALGAVFTLTRWEHANRVATVVSALAAVGVAVWAALSQFSSAGARVRRTGSATASGPVSRANSGVTGPAALSGSVVADRTGDAQATGGSSANSGVDVGR